jgi:hypothetical protein
LSATISRSAPPRARTLLDIFSATEVRCPDPVAIDAADATLTYHELADRARSLARRLNVGGHSVVMRGEQLPARSGWHGAPVVAI